MHTIQRCSEMLIMTHTSWRCQSYNWSQLHSKTRASKFIRIYCCQLLQSISPLNQQGFKFQVFFRRFGLILWGHHVSRTIPTNSVNREKNCLHLIWDQPGFQSEKSIIVGSRVPTHLTSKSLGSWVLGVLNPKQCKIKGVHLHSSFQEGPGLVRRMRSKRRSPGWKGRWWTNGPQMKWYCLIKRRVASLYIYTYCMYLLFFNMQTHTQVLPQILSCI